MAMSVAENPAVTERVPRSPQQTLAVGSLLGALYVLASLWLVFGGLPYVWGPDALNVAPTNPFLATALLMLLAPVLGVALGYVGYLLLRDNHTPGLRAGIFTAALMVFLALWLGEGLGRLLESRQMGGGVGFVFLGVVVGGLLAGTAFLFLQPGWARLMEAFEHQGWFTADPFKGSQGFRVRRGTILGVLAVAGFGIYAMARTGVFGTERPGLPPNDWAWTVPFTRLVTDDYQFTRYVPLMYRAHVIMPVVCAGLALWFAWRLVNVPRFADFLIATEAEMNKVSWTTRRRLIQDTIVVLVTVFLFTVFLFAVDLLWIRILTHPWVGVLMFDPQAQQQKQQEKTQW